MGWIIHEKRSRLSSSPWIARFVSPDGKNSFWLRVWGHDAAWTGGVFAGPAKNHHRLSDLFRATSLEEGRRKAMDEAKRIYKVWRERVMGWFLCRQPNGLFARFDSSNSFFTHFNMTEADVMEFAFEEWDIGRRTATLKLSDAKEDKIPLGPQGWITGKPAPPVRWNVALREIRGIRQDFRSDGGEDLRAEGDKLLAEAEKHGNSPVCTCPTECDCEAYPKLVSNSCPVHNDNPIAAADCPVHGEEALRLRALRAEKAGTKDVCIFPTAKALLAFGYTWNEQTGGWEKPNE